ncbi:hypothetical protein E2C01_051342 [Portunus trituberculatus]|uniref:Uncharacterized protein n=1 Tax=Portunus trituberculatus TaxID=210409 RepID=A0A5B7GEH2_PORTR|nr:hypothetical protein [Portunus trituberculatus]
MGKINTTKKYKRDASHAPGAKGRVLRPLVPLGAAAGTATDKVRIVGGGCGGGEEAKPEDSDAPCGFFASPAEAIIGAARYIIHSPKELLVHLEQRLTPLPTTLQTRAGVAVPARQPRWHPGARRAGPGASLLSCGNVRATPVPAALQGRQTGVPVYPEAAGMRAGEGQPWKLPDSFTFVFSFSKRRDVSLSLFLYGLLGSSLNLAPPFLSVPYPAGEGADRKLLEYICCFPFSSPWAVSSPAAVVGRIKGCHGGCCLIMVLFVVLWYSGGGGGGGGGRGGCGTDQDSEPCDE